MERHILHSYVFIVILLPGIVSIPKSLSSHKILSEGGYIPPYRVDVKSRYVRAYQTLRDQYCEIKHSPIQSHSIKERDQKYKHSLINKMNYKKLERIIIENEKFKD